MQSLFALDEAFDQLAASGFELPNGFVNHGPMACEALAAMGWDDAVGEWASRFARIKGTVIPVRGSRVQPELGRYGDLPVWIGQFANAIESDGWQPVVAEWVPRLMPALSVKLFHGTIRVAHAVRAVSSIDTPPRRAELARALGYWAACFRPSPGTRASAVSAVEQATEAARQYLLRPDIFMLHGVTGAMAVDLLVPHLLADSLPLVLGQLAHDHAGMFRVGAPAAPATDADLVALGEAAAAGSDPHEVKLVEACQRGFATTGDPAFPAAAAMVMRG